MVVTRNSRSDVVAAAGRLFAERGYHGTSMRDLGRELGLLGSSLYAHVESKQDLLVEVVEEGARLFQDSAEEALARVGPPPKGCVGSLPAMSPWCSTTLMSCAPSSTRRGCSMRCIVPV